ncbi:hypothetical protein M1N24_02270 [Dehalococcoidia bacterium]|nr:hypothetical protein [Dehalococcoidia bacterium]
MIVCNQKVVFLDRKQIVLARQLKYLSLSILIIGLLSVMSPAVTAYSNDSIEEPTIRILEPVNAVDLSGKITIEISVNGAKGQMSAVYFDMVGLSHDMITEDSFHRIVEVDTRKYYDGEHLINVHVHPPSGTEFHVGKLKVSTFNGYPAPNGDKLLPELTILRHKLTANSNLLNIRARLKDDGPIEGTQVLSHINRAIGRASSGRHIEMEGTGKAEKLFLAVYRVHLLAFQTDVPREITIRFFITDAVGRANLIDRNVLIPAKTARQEDIIPPTAQIVNMDMFQDFLPETIHVKLENAHMASDLVLWVGDKVINKIPLKGSETEVSIPVKMNRLASFFDSKIGVSSRATVVWLEFRPNIAAFPQLAMVSDVPKNVSIPVLGHKHINPIDLDNPLRPLRANFKVRPFVTDHNSHREYGANVRLILGKWSKVTFTVPSGVTFPLKRIGINFNGMASPLRGSVFVDEIKIGPSYPYSFEGAPASQWTKRTGGVSSITSSTAQAYGGNRSMEVTLSGRDSKGSVQFKAFPHITAGDVVAFYVYIPGPDVEVKASKHVIEKHR